MDLSIKRKLFIGYLTVLVLLIITAVVMIGKYAESNQRLLTMVDVSTRKVNLSREVMIALLEATRQEKNLILETNPVKRDRYKDRLYEALGNIERKTAELKGLTDEKGTVLLDEFIRPWDAYKSSIDSIVYYTGIGDIASATSITLDRASRIRESAINAMERLAIKNEESVQLAKAANNASYQDSRLLIISLVVVCVLVAIGMSYWIITGIGRRIRLIAREAETIASRAIVHHEIEDKTNDELSPVVAALSVINKSFGEIAENANAVASGNYATDPVPLSDKDTLGQALKKMTRSLRETTAENERHNWLTEGQNELNARLSGNQLIDELVNAAISFLCERVHAEVGAIYLYDAGTDGWKLSGSHAYPSTDAGKFFRNNEGLVGQVGRDQKPAFVSGVGEHQLRISSAVLNAVPAHVAVFPMVFEGGSLGVLEIASLKAFSETELEFMGKAIESIAISVHAAIARQKIQELLEETQVQSEELQAQQEELKQMNEELEEHTQHLRQQEEELRTSNTELEEQARVLEEKHREVEAAREEIAKQNVQLGLSSKYKSEFLANMSHELRTPLNSLLILSKDLSENTRGNLDADQVESAEIIYKSGNDLLKLINEVLDLSKVEAGKMSVTIEEISLSSFAGSLVRVFKPGADAKGLALDCKIDADVPLKIHTDGQRLNQVLNNLLGNAIKFTDTGSVLLHIARRGETRIEIMVTDTGIGIPEDKQALVFEAFQQADGGTARKYGGTGLGLSISRELTRLLGGELSVSSKPGVGTSFSLVLPVSHAGVAATEDIKQPDRPPMNQPVNREHFRNYPSIADDKEKIQPGDKVVLVIEDDREFAAILLKQANSKGFRCITASTGEDGLALAARYKPDAIMLDLVLPGMNGETVLMELKADPSLRHIPVHIMSVKEHSMSLIRSGAVEYLMKPVDKKELDNAFGRIATLVNRKVKNLLIVEDDENARKAICRVIGSGDVHCIETGTGADAVAAFSDGPVDCIVLDLGLPDMSGFELIRRLGEITDRHIPPIIIYTGKELTREENDELRKYAESIIIKGVKSEERLLDETALFLHRTISDLPAPKQAIINSLYARETVFQSRKILVVDDDMRNVFALSKVLRERGMEVIKADTGKVALDMLDRYPDIDLVLMDIMMPEMDGYEAMARIRARKEFAGLPIIALTAKAMKQDRDKCIAAGANDYVAKPVNVEQLLSLMRVWLNK